MQRQSRLSTRGKTTRHLSTISSPFKFTSSIIQSILFAVISLWILWVVYFVLTINKDPSQDTHGRSHEQKPLSPHPPSQSSKSEQAQNNIPKWKQSLFDEIELPPLPFHQPDRLRDDIFNHFYDAKWKPKAEEERMKKVILWKKKLKPST